MDTVIFVDWENLRYEIQKIQRDPKQEDFNSTTVDYNNALHVMALVRSFLLEEEKLKKVFFYTAKPIEDDGNEEYAKNSARILRFLDDIVRLPFVATRLGISKYRGVDPNGRPIIVQKQVDMLIGLDVAHVVYNRLAERIIIFSKDTDLVPALKCARINGITTILANLKDGFDISHSLIKHSDMIRDRGCSDILKYMSDALGQSRSESGYATI